MTAFAARYGPWALVAGASEGIGEAFADALARRGLDLLLVARRAAKLEATAAAIASRHGVCVIPISLDLGADDLEARLTAAVADREVGLLVYNAAFAPLGGFFEQSLDDKLKTVAVNCRGPLILGDRLGRPMVARRRGGMIFMGSLAGLQGSPRIATYAASKAFALVLGESLWGELRESGVDVLTCVAGATRTPSFVASGAADARGPVMDPEQVAEEALAALGALPSLIPGLANKLASFMLSRLPRRARVRLMQLAFNQGSATSRPD